MRLFFSIIFLLSSTKVMFGQEFSGVFYDPRDGQEYETVILELAMEGGVFTSREWFASNLNFESEESYCYKDYPEYCNAYGRLYSWEGALTACPAGWHMTTDIEWEMLTSNYGGIKQAAGEIKEGGESGLNIMMAGFGESDGTYIDIGVNGYYWKTQDLEYQIPGLITFHSGKEYLSADRINRSHRNSIRCVRDY